MFQRDPTQIFQWLACFSEQIQPWSIFLSCQFKMVIPKYLLMFKTKQPFPNGKWMRKNFLIWMHSLHWVSRCEWLTVLQSSVILLAFWMVSVSVWVRGESVSRDWPSAPDSSVNWATISPRHVESVTSNCSWSCSCSLPLLLCKWAHPLFLCQFSSH